MISHPATICDIAERLGIGKSTVHRALAGSPLCSEKTRKKVLAAAEELHYRPDPIFSTLGSRRRRAKINAVALAYIEDFSPGKSRPGGDYLPDVLKRAGELGYAVECINLQKWSARDRIWKILYARGFAGVLLGSIERSDLPLLLQNETFPIVCCGRIQNLPFHSVRNSVVSAVRLIWENLIELGYRRIGAAFGHFQTDLEDDFARYAAAMGCLDHFHTQKEFIPPLQSLVGDVDSFVKWFNKHRPEVLVFMNPGVFSAIYYPALLKLKVQVPKDVGCAFINLPMDSDEQYAGVIEDTRLVAHTAVSLIDQMIRHGERGVPEKPISSVISPVWNPGKSCPPVRKASQH